VPLFFHEGAGYERAAAGLALVALGLPFVFLNLQARYLLAAVGKQHAYLWAVAAGLVVNVVGCVATARTLGVTGAAASYMAAEFTVFLVCRHAQAAHVGVADLLRAAVRPLLATLIMAVAVYFCRGAILPLSVLVGVVTYVAALYATRALSREEWRLVRQVIVSFRLPGSRRLADDPGQA
jgi:O-antigen/teichoic acid export membrane protein